MKVSVPVKAPIGGRQISIKYKEQIEPDKDGGAVFADVDAMRRTINVSKAEHKTAREIFESIFHEMLHYSLRSSGLATIIGPKVEEAIVECLEERIAPLVCFHPDAGIKYREIEFPWDE